VSPITQLAPAATVQAFVLHTPTETLHARAVRHTDVPRLLGADGIVHRADRPCARCVRDLAEAVAS
jgi:hypothetical protein